MTNSYYNPTGTPGTGAAGASSPVRTEFAAIAAGFAALPTFSGGSAGQAVIINSSGTGIITSGALVFDSSGNATLTNNVALNGAGSTLTFGSTSQRILADLSNATLASRLMFQSSAVNGNTSLGVLPNGTSTTAAVTVYNTAVPTNSGAVVLRSAAASSQLDSIAVGSGTVLPLDLMIAGASKLRISTAGNVLIGTTVDNSSGALQVAGGVSITGSLSAAFLSGAGTGISGTASFLNIGGNAATATTATTATTASTANALNTGNSYTVVGLTATGAFSGPTTGVTSGSVASAGQVGQILTNSASAVTMTSANTWYAIVSLSLTAGDWDISGEALVLHAGAPSPQIEWGISTTSAVAPATAQVSQLSLSSSIIQNFGGAIVPYRVSIAATTTFYLNAVSGAASGSGYGTVTARRIR